MTPATVEDMGVSVRLMAHQDEALVFSSWLKSYRRGADVAQVPGAVYFAEHHRAIERILKRESTMALVMTPTEDPAQIVGWLVAERIRGVLVLHYVYVKEAFRRLGRASGLLSLVVEDTPEGIQHTHLTEVGKVIAARLRSTFNPYLAR